MNKSLDKDAAIKSNQHFRGAMKEWGWFSGDGVTIVYDGQFGSTGKGLLSAVLSHIFRDSIRLVTTNSGPNSGHKARLSEKKFYCRQLPMSALYMTYMGLSPRIYLNCGAVIHWETLLKDLSVLAGEASARYRYNMPYGQLIISPRAAVVHDEHMDKNTDIASTGTGVGPALANKINRQELSVWGQRPKDNRAYPGIETRRLLPEEIIGGCLVEVPQGYHLGINSGLFPHVTARECSPVQAMSDLGIPNNTPTKTVVSLRTMPIRTGNLGEVSSGPGWSGDDREELSWDALGLYPEKASVTGRERRIFRWNWNQYEDMLVRTAPDALFINFCNYLAGACSFNNTPNWMSFVDAAVGRYREVLGHAPDFVMTGHGDAIGDVRLMDYRRV